MWLSVLESGWAGPWRIVAISGEIDIATAPQLRDRLADILHRRSPRVILDLAQVAFCDSSGLAVFVATARRARLLGGDLLLTTPTAQVRKTLEVTGLDRHLRVYPGTAADIPATVTDDPATGP